jgi:hypothetical protein
VASGQDAEHLRDLRNELEGTRDLDRIGVAVQQTTAALADVAPDDALTVDQKEKLAASLATLRAAPLEDLFRSAADRARVKEHMGLLISLAAAGYDSWRDLVVKATARAPGADEPLPATTSSTFAPRTFLWSQSPIYDVGKPAAIEAIVATSEPVTATLEYRRLGEDAYAEVPMQRGFGASFSAAVPSDILQGDVIEYFVEVRHATSGETIPALRYPTTAPLRPLWMVANGASRH